MGKLITDLFKPRKIRGARAIKSPTNKAYEKLAEKTIEEIRSRRRWTPEQVRKLLIPIGG